MTAVRARRALATALAAPRRPGRLRLPGHHRGPRPFSAGLPLRAALGGEAGRRVRLRARPWPAAVCVHAVFRPFSGGERPVSAAPVLAPRDWRTLAACQYTDPDLFFIDGGSLFEAAAIASDQARRVCLGCPVRRECLAYALAAGEPHGTWGGLSERQLRAERGRRRPAEEVIAEADVRYFRREDRRLGAEAAREARGLAA